jgi:hypothetical protein
VTGPRQESGRRPPGKGTIEGTQGADLKSPIQHDVYQHAARPEWGGAVIAWERDGKRGYLFEDGHQRIFAAAHYHLLELVAGSDDRARKLRRLADIPEAAIAAAPGPDPKLPSLDEQLALFLTTFPGGFGGARWQTDHRGAAARIRKRHRDPAIARACQDLTSGHLASCLERGRDREGIDTLANVLGRTDLVSWADVQTLCDLPPNRSRGLLIGLFELLFGRTAIDVRMVQWVQALGRSTGRRPAWTLVTAPLALLSPDRHVCVHRASFIIQATAMELRPRLAQAPRGVEYAPLLAMAEQVRAHLRAAGSSPADLLDVHDFILFTLRPAAVREMAASRRS